MRKSEYALALTKMIAGVQINERKTLHLYLFIYLFGQWLLFKKSKSLWWRSHNRFEKINTKITDHEYQPSLTIVSEKCQSNCKFHPPPPGPPPSSDAPWILLFYNFYCTIIHNTLPLFLNNPYLKYKLIDCSLLFQVTYSLTSIRHAKLLVTVLFRLLAPTAECSSRLALTAALRFGLNSLVSRLSFQFFTTIVILLS